MLRNIEIPKDMRFLGFDINVQRREAVQGVPSSTNEQQTQTKAEGANYPDRTVYVRDPQTALSVGTVYRAIELRARTMGLMPVQYQKKDVAGGNYVQDMRGLGKRLNYLLQVQPNPLMTAAQLWELVTVNQLTFGNGFVYIERDEFDFPVALWSVSYGSYNIATGLYNLTYLTDQGYMERVNVPRTDVIHIPNTYRMQGGVWGIPTLRYMIQTLSYIKTQQAQNLDTAAKGGRVKGFISEDKGPGQLGLGMYGKETSDNYAMSLQEKLYSGQDIVALRGLEKWQSISLTSQEMQALENVGASNDDVARFFATPRPLLMLDTNSHYNDYSNATMEYHTRTILPEKNFRELEISRKLLGFADYGYKRIHICERPLMAMDPERQAKVDSLHIQNGTMSVNEVRKEHDQPTVPNGDLVYMSTNLAELGSPKLSGVDGKTLEPGNYTVPVNKDGKTEGEDKP